MKSSVQWFVICTTVTVFSLLIGSASHATHEGQGFAPEKKAIFTKHFNESLFDITRHASYSVEVLLNDKEYKIGKDVIGVVVHDSRDEDLKGADLSIVFRNAATGENIAAKGVADKGNGLYIVSGLDLQKEGKWELVIAVKKSGVEDGVKFVLPDALKARVPKGRYSP